MKAHELEQLLREGHYLIVAFGNVYLWKGVERVADVPLSVFHKLIKDDLLHGQDIEPGAARYTLKRSLGESEKKINWQDRAKKAEKELDTLKRRVEELEAEINSLREQDIVELEVTAEAYYTRMASLAKIIKDINKASHGCYSHLITEVIT